MYPGKLSGNVLTGRWDEAPTRKGPGDAGEVILTRSGKTFTGTWNYDGDKTLRTNWSGTCTSGPCLGDCTARIGRDDREYRVFLGLDDERAR